MTAFADKKIIYADINNGIEYEDGDTPSGLSTNAPIEAAGYAQTQADLAVDVANLAIAEATEAKTAVANKVDEAPIDGKPYVRKNGAWDEDTGGESEPEYTPYLTNTSDVFLSGKGIEGDYSDSIENAFIKSLTLTGKTETSKNLFNKNDYNIINAYMSADKVTSSVEHRTIYIKCEPNTTYTISRILLTQRFNWAWTEVLPSDNVSYYDMDVNVFTTDNATVTTGATAKYLSGWVNRALDEGDLIDELIQELQIEVGSTATPYTPYYSGLKSVKGNQELVCTEKNLLNNKDAIVGYINQYGDIDTNVNQFLSGYIKVPPNSTLVTGGTDAFTENNIQAFYNSNKAFIGFDYVNPNQSFTTTADTKYVRVNRKFNYDVTESNLRDTKCFLYLDTTNFDYKPYEENITHVDSQELGSVGDVHDTIIDGVKTIRTKEFYLTNENFSSLNTDPTNVDSLIMSYTGMEDFIDYQHANSIAKTFISEKTSPRNGLPAFVWSHTFNNDNWIITMPKGYYANIAEAKADLVGLQCRYVLKTPIVTDISYNPLIAYKGGIQYIKQVINEAFDYTDTGIILPYAVSKINKIEDSYGNPITNYTLDTTGLIVTITGATTIDSYFINADIKTELTLTPNISEIYAINVTAQVKANTGAIANTIKVAGDEQEKLAIAISEINELQEQSPVNSVTIDTDQTITSVKIFTNSPIVPVPLNDNESANKKYVDDNSSGGSAVPTVRQLDNAYVIFNATAGDNTLHFRTGTGFLFTIDKGDGTAEIDGSATGGYQVINYVNAGRYMITIKGSFDGFDITFADGKEKYIEVYLGSNSGLSVIEDAFKNCENLEIFEFYENTIIIGSSCLSGCSKLKEIKIPSNQLTQLGNNSFSGCSSLEKIYITTSSNITTFASNYMFGNCVSLEKIIIPDNIKTYGFGAFLGCTNLKSFQLKYQVGITFDDISFQDVKLTDLIVTGGATQIQAEAIKTAMTTAGASFYEGFRLMY